MGEVIAFKTKAERAGLAPPKLYAEMTADEQFDHLWTKTLVHMRDLAYLYRGAGKFTPDCEQSMVLVVERLKKICQDVAGTTGEGHHAPTENAG